MPRFPVYEYRCDTSRGTITVPTFKPVAGRRPVGQVVAPEGAAMRDAGQGVLKLKVPKEGRPGEFWVMTADEARAAAVANKDGLRWEPATAAREEHARV